MTPIWLKNNMGNWAPALLLETTKIGSDTKYLVAFDDRPPPAWGVPVGSWAFRSAYEHEVRLRRTVIPLLEDMNGG